MESVAFLDTHVVVWLAAGKTGLLSPLARSTIEKADRLLMSPMVLLELHFLREIQRIGIEPSEVMLEAATQVGVQLADHSFRNIIESSKEHSWTRDPFDRIIVGHAHAAAAQLVTKDETIRKNFARACW